MNATQYPSLQTQLLHTQLVSLSMNSPFLNASGPLGWFIENKDIIDYSELGAFILKGLTKEKRQGNTGTRIQILQQGLINAIGLENPGIHDFLRYMYPSLSHHIAKTHLTCIANISGTTIDEYMYLAHTLHLLDNINAIEINLSCPNIDKGGLHFIQDHTTVREILTHIRRETDKELIVKIPHIENEQELKRLISLIEESGINIISAINTVSTESPLFLKIKKQYHLEKCIKGGISGTYIKEYALHTIRIIKKYSSLSIIGLGGITYFDDVLDFLKAGAHAVAIGSASLYNYALFSHLSTQLRAFMQKHTLSSIDELYRTIPNIL